MAGVRGEKFREAIQSAHIVRPALIEEFLLEGKVMMISGEPGTGKSIVATQIAMSATTGKDLFGLLTIPAPLDVCYLQLEGSDTESFERVGRMEQAIPLDTDKLLWCYEIGLDLMSRTHADKLLEVIKEQMQPKLFILDPLYQAVSGELSKELPCKAIVRFVDRFKATFPGCGVILIHHTGKPTYNQKGEPIEKEDPSYGSQWLKAAVDVSYLLKAMGGKYRDQVMLVNKKSRGGDVVKELILHYDPETDTVTTDVPLDERSGEERVVLYLRTLKKSNKTTNFFEVMEHCKLSTRHVRNIQKRLLARGLLRCDKLDGKKKVWEPA